jgi:hypothetical protein
VTAMSMTKNLPPRSFEHVLAQVPENLRAQPLTMGQFLRFMELLVNSNKALKKRVVQLEEKVNGQSDGHG